VASTFKQNEAVLFDLFNEPYGLDWPCWRNGGCEVFAGDEATQFTSEGMQQMVDQVRQSGATTQPILLGGLQYANDMRGWLEHLPDDPSDSIAASIHLYDFSYPCPTMVGSPGTAAAAIDCFKGPQLNSIETIAEQHPVIFGELGQGGCRSDFVGPLLEWLLAREHSVLGWAWNTYDCADFPSLITDFDGTPTAFGLAFRDAFRAAAETAAPQ
jgi:hypothetical protein